MNTLEKSAATYDVAAAIRNHIDTALVGKAWLTRRANAYLMARERYYSEHQQCTGPNLSPWYSFVREDGTSATRNGTRWVAISDLLENYVVNQLVDQTSIWRTWINVVDSQCASFNEELGNLFVGWVGRSAFETPYEVYARQYARDKVSALLMDQENLVMSDWCGTPITEDEITAVLVAAQLQRPTP
jgi:hypothetical protein